MSTRAPSTKVLRNFKGNFVAATKTILENGGWSDVVLERTLAKLKAAARKEISFDLGEAFNQELLDSGKRVYDFFPGRLKVRIVTARRQDESAPVPEIRDLHDQFTAEALDLLAEELNPYTEALLPYYSVKTIKPLGTKSDLDVIYFEDYTDVEFFIQFGIRSTAWPVGY